jgi:hypothetical protein
MITTKKEFQTFISEFKRLQNILNLNDWDVCFELKKIDEWGKIWYSVKNRLAVVYVNTTHKKTDSDFIKLAKHEVFHLFVADLLESGKDRFTTEFEMNLINERMCTVFET